MGKDELPLTRVSGNPLEIIQMKLPQAAIDEIAETKKSGIELQRSQMLLDTSDGIKVKIDPNY